MKAWKRLVRVFDGTKECHAALDSAIADAKPVMARAERIIAARKKAPPQAPVTNGAH